ncbi:hypothetical protein ACFE04_014948 [Oxalis oulophora]
MVEWLRDRRNRTIMINNNNNNGVSVGGDRVVAVAIDNNKRSQQVVKWAIENILNREQTLRLVHVVQRQPSTRNNIGVDDDVAQTQSLVDRETTEMFLPYRCYCLRREINAEPVVLEDPDVAKALIEYSIQFGVHTLLLGAPSKNNLARLFKITNICGNVMKWAPDFCNVFVISKGRISASRSASRPVPNNTLRGGTPVEEASLTGGGRFYDEIPTSEADMNLFSERISTDSSFFNFYDNMEPSMSGRSSRVSADTDRISSALLDKDQNSWAAQDMNISGETDEEMRRLQLELKQTMEMYHAACREALAARQKAIELEQWKAEAENRIQDVRKMDDSEPTSILKEEKSKYKAAIEAAEAAQKIIESEIQKRKAAELKALREADERRRVIEAFGQSQLTLQYQCLYHIVIVLFLFYFYFSL